MLLICLMNQIITNYCFDMAPETEAFTESCSGKKLFWKISQISLEKAFHEVLSSFCCNLQLFKETSITYVFLWFLQSSTENF